MSSYDSIIEVVDRIKTELDHFDIAILNAGVYHIHESFASTGYEGDVQVNYLSTMLLTILLLPVLKDKKTGSGPVRLVVVTSETTSWAKFVERTSVPLLPAFKKDIACWDMAERCATSKLLGLLLLSELVEHIRSPVVTVSYANPGFRRVQNLDARLMACCACLSSCLLTSSAAHVPWGARSFVHAAMVLGKAAHGQYIEGAKI